MARAVRFPLWEGWQGPAAAGLGAAWAVLALGGADRGMDMSAMSRADELRPALMGMTGAVALLPWAAMAAAMMLPGALPALRHVAVNSLRWRRRRAVATFAAVYLGVWVGFGALVYAASPLWSTADASAVAAAALALAAGYQLTAHKRRAVRDCHRPLPLPPRGRRATAGLLRFASYNSLACVRSCWAMMLAMAVATSTLVPLLAIAAIVTAEKRSQKPGRTIRVAAALLAAGALATALA
jgi:predicted metal-binding membrane protein